MSIPTVADPDSQDDEVPPAESFDMEGGMMGLLAILVGVMALGVWVSWRRVARRRNGRASVNI